MSQEALLYTGARVNHAEEQEDEEEEQRGTLWGYE